MINSEQTVNGQLTVRSPQDILVEFRSLVADAEAMIGNAAAEHSEEVVDAMRRRYEAVQGRLTEMCAGAKQKAVAGATYADKTLHRNLYASLAVAAGVGMLTGLLLARRRGRGDMRLGA